MEPVTTAALKIVEAVLTIPAKNVKKDINS